MCQSAATPRVDIDLESGKLVSAGSRLHNRCYVLGFHALDHFAEKVPAEKRYGEEPATENPPAEQSPEGKNGTGTLRTPVVAPREHVAYRKIDLKT